MELDISHGLLPEIEIDCNSVVITQKLDYLKMLFHCSYYHETEHLRKSCSFLLHGHPVHAGFIDPEPLLVISPYTSSPHHLPQDSLPQVDPLSDSLDPPPMAGPYDSSSHTSMGELTKGELLYIKDVESLALLASRIDQNVNAHE